MHCFRSSSYLIFMKNSLNIIDFVAVAPFIIEVIFWNISTADRTATILKFLRLVRALRILRLGAHSESLRMLGGALWQALSYIVDRGRWCK